MVYAGSCWSVPRLTSGRADNDHLLVTKAAPCKCLLEEAENKKRRDSSSLEKRLLWSCFTITLGWSRSHAENSPQFHVDAKVIFFFWKPLEVHRDSLGSCCQSETPVKKKMIKNQQKPVARLQTGALIAWMTTAEFNFPYYESSILNPEQTETSLRFSTRRRKKNLASK